MSHFFSQSHCDFFSRSLLEPKQALGAWICKPLLVWKAVAPLFHSSFLSIGICFVISALCAAEGQLAWLHWWGRVLPRTSLSSAKAVVSQSSWERNSFFFSPGLIQWDFCCCCCCYCFYFCWHASYISIFKDICLFLLLSLLSGSVPGFYSPCRPPELLQTDNEDTWIKCLTDLPHFGF